MTDFRKLFDLSGRVALITGASVGFGEAISLAFADYGCDIAASDLDLAATLRLVEKVTRARPGRIWSGSSRSQDK